MTLSRILEKTYTAGELVDFVAEMQLDYSLAQVFGQDTPEEAQKYDDAVEFVTKLIFEGDKDQAEAVINAAATMRHGPIEPYEPAEPYEPQSAAS